MQKVLILVKNINDCLILNMFKTNILSEQNDDYLKGY